MFFQQIQLKQLIAMMMVMEIIFLEIMATPSQTNLVKIQTQMEMVMAIIQRVSKGTYSSTMPNNGRIVMVMAMAITQRV